MIKVGILGAAGFTAGELTRILLNHPEVELSLLHSESQAGKPISSIHQGLIGETSLPFHEEVHEEADVYFLCKGHGESRKLVSAYPFLTEKKVIDLSHDFRLKGEHAFIYGLPEVNRELISRSNHIANPGCFATAIQLGLAPAVAQRLIHGEINTSGITGSTGAGQAMSSTMHFSWRSNNASVYKALTHQHLQEIGETVTQLDPEFKHGINFIPYRGAFTRGIIITSYFDTMVSEEELTNAYHSFYQEAPHTHVIDENPDLKMVVNTNKCIIYPKVVNGKAVVISVIDNLLKGASGQAVENMNLLFGINQKTGLNLKPSGF